ncbi:MAG: type II toxin-antitoxin system PemK/MazF family toxin [Acidimicrobiales bacterium]
MRGDIHHLLTPRGRKGHEQDGQRYAVVLQSDDLPLSTVVVAPTSTSCRPAAFRPEITFGGMRTYVMVDQLAAVDWSRLGHPVSRVGVESLQDLDRAIGLVLS